MQWGFVEWTNQGGLQPRLVVQSSEGGLRSFDEARECADAKLAAGFDVKIIQILRRESRINRAPPAASGADQPAPDQQQ